MRKKPQRKKTSRKRPLNLELQALGERIRITREEQGLNQADCSGIDGAQLSKLENGKHQPTADNLLRIARWLGVRVDWLLDGTPPRWMGQERTAFFGPTDVDIGKLANLVAARLQEGGQSDRATHVVTAPDDQRSEPPTPRARARPRK